MRSSPASTMNHVSLSVCGHGMQAILPRADGAGGGHALQRLRPPRHRKESAYLCQLAGPQGQPPLPGKYPPSLPGPLPPTDLAVTSVALLPYAGHQVLHNHARMLQLLSKSHHSCPVRLFCSCCRRPCGSMPLQCDSKRTVPVCSQPRLCGPGARCRCCLHGRQSTRGITVLGVETRTAVVCRLCRTTSARAASPATPTSSTTATAWCAPTHGVPAAFVSRSLLFPSCLCVFQRCPHIGGPVHCAAAASDRTATG